MKGIVLTNIRFSLHKKNNSFIKTKGLYEILIPKHGSSKLLLHLLPQWETTPLTLFAGNVLLQ
jgi:hypothetical protein